MRNTLLLVIGLVVLCIGIRFYVMSSFHVESFKGGHGGGHGHGGNPGKGGGSLGGAAYGGHGGHGGYGHHGRAYGYGWGGSSGGGWYGWPYYYWPYYTVPVLYEEECLDGYCPDDVLLY
jgi:hypothetical protein